MPESGCAASAVGTAGEEWMEEVGDRGTVDNPRGDIYPRSNSSRPAWGTPAWHRQQGEAT